MAISTLGTGYWAVQEAATWPLIHPSLPPLIPEVCFFKEYVSECGSCVWMHVCICDCVYVHSIHVCVQPGMHTRTSRVRSSDS